MTSSYFLSQLMNGLKIGSVYAIVAIGYSMVYGILRLINFAHGDILTVGVYSILTLMAFGGLPLWLIIIISICISIGVVVMVDRFAYRLLQCPLSCRMSS